MEFNFNSSSCCSRLLEIRFTLYLLQICLLSNAVVWFYVKFVTFIVESCVNPTSRSNCTQTQVETIHGFVAVCHCYTISSASIHIFHLDWSHFLFYENLQSVSSIPSFLTLLCCEKFNFSFNCIFEWLLLLN